MIAFFFLLPMSYIVHAWTIIVNVLYRFSLTVYRKSLLSGKFA